MDTEDYTQINLFYQYLTDEIKNYSNFIKNTLTNFIVYFKKLSSNEFINIEKEFQLNTTNLINNMDFFRTKLERKEFENEFCIFDRIISMTNFILNNEFSNIPSANISLIIDVCNLFFNLLDYKIKLIKKHNFNLDKDFQDEYEEEFLKFINEYDELYSIYLNDIKKVEFTNLDKLKKHCSFVYEEFL